MSDNSGVEGAVGRYVQGVYDGDADLVKSSFHEESKMWGYLGEQLVIMSGADFADAVVGTATAPASGSGPYESNVHSVIVTGNTATAILDEKGYLGADFHNRFGLIRENGEWKIVSKLFEVVGGTVVM